MNSPFPSLFSSHEGFFIEWNPNLLETNLINIVILLALLVYTYKASFANTLEKRQQEILQSIENAQQDLSLAQNSYFLAEKDFTQSLLIFYLWQNVYQEKKKAMVLQKYQKIHQDISHLFLMTESLLVTMEEKNSFSLQRYLLLLMGGQILRKFFSLSSKEQQKLIEASLDTLGGPH
jgi:hypothetical protein